MDFIICFHSNQLLVVVVLLFKVSKLHSLLASLSGLLGIFDMKLLKTAFFTFSTFRGRRMSGFLNDNWGPDLEQIFSPRFPQFLWWKYTMWALGVLVATGLVIWYRWILWTELKNVYFWDKIYESYYLTLSI